MSATKQSVIKLLSPGNRFLGARALANVKRFFGSLLGSDIFFRCEKTQLHDVDNFSCYELLGASL